MVHPSDPVELAFVAAIVISCKAYPFMNYPARERQRLQCDNALLDRVGPVALSIKTGNFPHFEPSVCLTEHEELIEDDGL
jgi:hypothetical protein